MDFFICHNQADYEWLEWIDWHLRKFGLETFVPDWDIQPGDNEILTIQRALTDAAENKRERKVIVIHSKNFSTESVGQTIWTTFLTDDPESLNRNIILVKIDDSNITNPFFKPLRAIELSSVTDKLTAVEKLKSGVFALDPRPTQEPPFPGKPPPNYPNTLEKAGMNAQRLAATAQTKVSFKAKPEYQLAQVDRVPQSNHFQKVISKDCIANNGKTWGFVVCGPTREWPTGLRFKLRHLLSSDFIDDDSFSPILFLLRTEKCKNNKSAQEWLWGLFKENLKLTAKSINVSELEKTLETDGNCYVFVRELSSDEASNAEFIAEMLAMWDSIKLSANSKSQFLLLIHETQNSQPTPKKWWGFTKKAISWEDELRKALEAKTLSTSAILPPLQPPEWEHIFDWLKAHFMDDQESLRDEIENTLKQAFPNDKSIPHLELKKRLIKFFQSNQT